MADTFYLYHGGDRPTDNKGFGMWPNVELTEESNIGPSAAHRGHTSHQAISRCIDFREVLDSGPRSVWANQDALRQWYMDDVDEFEVDDILGVIAIPAYEDWKTTYYRLCSPVEGLTADLIEVFSGEVIEAGVDLGVAGAFGLIAQDDDKRMTDKNRLIGWQIKALPTPAGTLCTPAPKALDNLCLCTSAEVVVPWTGK
jgi:hypothetical protein